MSGVNQTLHCVAEDGNLSIVQQPQASNVAMLVEVGELFAG